MNTVTYPQPVVTQTNRPMLEAWSRGKLLLQRCRACEVPLVVPREVCPACWSPELDWERRSGRGRITTLTAVYSHVTPPFVDEAPVHFCEIELAEGGTLLARVVDIAGTRGVEAGRAVELLPLAEATRYPLPTFRCC
jgi:uncharacterized OB-fold protein